VLGAVTYLGFEVLVLSSAFVAIHAHPVPGFAVVAMAYVIGALGGSLPLPASLGTVGGIAGMLIVYGLNHNPAVLADNAPRPATPPATARSTRHDARPRDPLSHRIAAVPFTLRNLREDLEDLGSNFDGAPDLEFRMASKALELEQSGLSYQRIPPDYRFPYGHTHKEQEEVYVVVGGSGRMKLDDEIVELKKWDAVRVPPGTWRGYEAGPEGLEILVIGAPNLGEAPREDVDGQRDWWTD
jgi:mannose-6-phosphate isomerase-like protein (cupin superfamily)